MNSVNKINTVDIFITIIICILTFLSLAPIVTTLMMSFSDQASAAIGRVYFWPVNFNLAAYGELLKDARFFTAFGVSIRRVLLGTSLTVILSIFMAYPLSKDKNLFPARNIYIWYIVFTMLFSGGLIPSFILVKNLKLIDTIWALVLPGAVNVFNTLILMNFYKGIPNSLEESAMVDGASPLRILVQIYIPLAKASIATITLFTAVGHWNSFFDGRIYINTPEKIPLQTYIQSLTVNLNPRDLLYMSAEQIVERMKVSNLTFNAAKVIVSMIPIIAIYPFLQRFFVTGIVLGAVKE